MYQLRPHESKLRYGARIFIRSRFTLLGTVTRCIHAAVFHELANTDIKALVCSVQQYRVYSAYLQLEYQANNWQTVRYVSPLIVS